MPYVKKGGHGGNHGGAGRKTLTKVQRLLVGAEAERVFRTDRPPLKYLDLNYDDVLKSQAALNAVPLSKRGKRKSKDEPCDPEDHLEWLEEELEGRRVQKALRPSLSEVCARLAPEASAALGKPVSARQVRRWRQDFLNTKRKA